jgi:cytochrome c551/c552
MPNIHQHFWPLSLLTCCVLASVLGATKDQEESLFKTSGCIACHRMTQPMIGPLAISGPSMLAISEKYADTPNGLSIIIKSLKEGASGKWGKNIMPPQAQVKPADWETLAKWTLKIKDSPNLSKWQEKDLSFKTSISGKAKLSTATTTFPLIEERNGTIVRALDRPIVYRTYLPGASSRAIAVGLPGDISYAFDAKLCKLLYFWKGGFLDFEKSWTGHGGWYSKLMGTKIFEAPASFPLRIGSNQNPEVKFIGYRTDGKLPSFIYEINGISVEETIGFDSDNRTIVLSFDISDVEEPIYFDPGKSSSFWSSDDAVEQEGVWNVHPEKRKNFSFQAQVK